MKAHRKLLAFVLAFAMLCTTGCGMVCDITVSKDGTETVDDAKLYMTADELTANKDGSFRLTDQDLVVNDVTEEQLNGKDYYVMEGNADDFLAIVNENSLYQGLFKGLNLLGIEQETNNIAENNGYLSSAKFEMAQATYGVDEDDLAINNTIYGQGDFLYYKITFPYKVLAANGTISDDGYTVTYNVGYNVNHYPKSGFRIYACFTETAKNDTGITITGAADGKVYSSSRTIQVKTNGTVKALKLNGKTIAGRTITLSNNGTYKLVVKLASGAEKTIKFSIKKYYKLTYKVNGGYAFKTSTKKIRYGYKYGTLKVPERSGYTFLGWYTKKSGGTKVTAKTVCKGNVTVYAHWKKITTKKYYKLTYKVNGGNAFKTSTKKIRYGYKYGKLKVPARKGYKFLGWYTKKTGGTKVTAKTICKKSVTVYAHWMKK